ncbi:hypothetical protein QYF36_008024 [Acer negundo]|nr:hypothetical protein QYF36_008024 [Acer negundo]
MKNLKMNYMGQPSGFDYGYKNHPVGQLMCCRENPPDDSSIMQLGQISYKLNTTQHDNCLAVFWPSKSKFWLRPGDDNRDKAEVSDGGGNGKMNYMGQPSRFDYGYKNHPAGQLI